MKTKKGFTMETEFVRSFSIKKGKHLITGNFQPYAVGMYAAIEDSKVSQLIQLNLTHKQVGNWFKKLSASFEKDGYKVVINKAQYGQFLSESDITNYLN